eukprot:17680-Chlamydomonas_euryale.AAC.5
MPADSRPSTRACCNTGRRASVGSRRYRLPAVDTHPHPGQPLVLTWNVSRGGGGSAWRLVLRDVA